MCGAQSQLEGSVGFPAGVAVASAVPWLKEAYVSGFLGSPVLRR